MGKLSIKEYVMHATVRIETNDQSGNMAYASGFLVTLPNTDSKLSAGHLCLVTNRHVFQDVDSIRIIFTQADSNDKPVYGQQVVLNIHHILSTDLIKYHPNPKVDLALLRMEVLIRQQWGQGIHHFFTYISYESFLPPEEWKNLDAVEGLLMVGYPNGLWDEHNNLPIFRRGITASHPAFDYNNTSCFLADIACFPGSSGSPVFLHNEFVSMSCKEDATIIQKSELKLLGILHAGPISHVDGIDPVSSEKVSESVQFLNLGEVIKSTCLFDFNV